MHPIRTLLTLGALAGGAAATAAWLAPAAPAQDAEFPWRKSLADARREARETGKPLFVRFR